MIDLTKVLKTRDGSAVRIRSMEPGLDYPVQGEVQQENGSWSDEVWTLDGIYLQSDYDLVNPEKEATT